MFFESSLFVLFLDEFHATVFGAASVGLVVGNRFVGALTDGTHVERVATKLFEGFDDGLSTLLGERIVHSVGALIVGMTLYLEAGAGVLLHIVGHLLDLRHRLRLQRSLARLEEDIVGHEFTCLGNRLLNSGEVCGLTLIEIGSTLG